MVKKIGNVSKLPDNITFETFQGTLQETQSEMTKKFPWIHSEEFYRLGDENSNSGYTYYPMEWKRDFSSG